MTTLNESSKITLTIGQLRRLIAETVEPIDETGLPIGGKVYPPTDNVLILAGGAGSGKGFIRNNVLFFNGKVLDVDDIKPLVLKYGELKPNDPMPVDFQNQYGYSLANVDLKNPKQATDVHEFIKGKKFADKRAKTFFDNAALAEPGTKPNVIFDDAMKNMSKFKKCCRLALDAGYDKKNIHLVWVVNSFQTAIGNNLARSRSAPMDVLLDTHTGAAMTMNDIMHFTRKVYLNHWMDGDVWIVFSQKDVDTKSVTHPLNLIPGDDLTNKERPDPTYLEEYTAYQLKKQGEPIKPYKYVEDWVKDKIMSYVPNKVKSIFRR